jgi:hypothetical protein
MVHFARRCQVLLALKIENLPAQLVAYRLHVRVAQVHAFAEAARAHEEDVLTNAKPIWLRLFRFDLLAFGRVLDADVLVMMLFPRFFARPVRVKGDHAAVAVESLAAVIRLDKVEAADGFAGLDDVLEAAVAPSPPPVIEHLER